MLAPPHGFHCVVFIDDLAVATADTSGAQLPLEVLRQCIDAGGWHDPKALHFKALHDVSFVSSMATSPNGRTAVDPRFLRHFQIMALPLMAESDLRAIFASILAAVLRPYRPEMQEMAGPLTEATLQVSK